MPSVPSKLEFARLCKSPASKPKVKAVYSAATTNMHEDTQLSCQAVLLLITLSVPVLARTRSTPSTSSTSPPHPPPPASPPAPTRRWTPPRLTPDDDGEPDFFGVFGDDDEYGN